MYLKIKKKMGFLFPKLQIFKPRSMHKHKAIQDELYAIFVKIMRKRSHTCSGNVFSQIVSR